VTQKALNRAIGSAIAIVLAATMTVVGASGSAHAAAWGYTWTDFDNMEPRSTSTAADRFFLENDGPTTVGRWVTASSGQLFVHSGLNAAEVYRAGSWQGGSFAAVGKYVTVTPRQVGYWPTCQFSAWVYSGEGERYNIEVIDPATWNYISLKQFTQPPGSWTWRQVTTGQFNVPRRVVLRVSYLVGNSASSAFADDFRLTCTY
jgi:hypothetical protein